MKTVAEEDDSIRPIVAVKIVNPVTNQEISTFALLDTGSDRDVIDEGLAKDLMLKTTSRMMNISVLGAQELSPREIAKIRMESIDGKYKAEVQNALVGNLLTCNSDIPPAKRNFDKLHHLAHLPFHDLDSEVRVIIGIDHCESLAGKNPNEFVEGPPHAVRTVFGWTIFGQDKKITMMKSNMTKTSDEALQEKLDKIFFNDFTGVSEEEMGQSRENREAIRQLKESIKFDENRHKYVVALPWKHGRERSAEILASVDSKGMAKRRLMNMIPKMKRDPVWRRRVFAQAEKFTSSGVATCIDGQADVEPGSG